MKHTHGLAIPTTLQDVCHPQRMALLVYDMQVGICSQVKTAGQVVTRISGLLAVARSKGMRVAFTRHLSLPTTWMGSMQYRTAMAWQGKDDRKRRSFEGRHGDLVEDGILGPRSELGDDLKAGCIAQEPGCHAVWLVTT